MPVSVNEKAAEVPERLTVGFISLLRSLGLQVPIGSAIVFQQALGKVGIGKRESVYWAGRSTLITDPEDLPVYEYGFRVFWEGLTDALEERIPSYQRVALVTDDGIGTEEELSEASNEGRDVINLRYSPSEVLWEKDFGLYTSEELNEAYELMKGMTLLGGIRQSRRKISSKKKSQYPDLRRTIKSSLRTDGEPIRQRFLEVGDRQRRVVFLLDISGSLEAYSRALLRFVQAAVVGRRQVEAFTLGTRLTRITRELSSRNLDQAVSASSNAVQDWSGGTQLGETLRSFNIEWGQRGVARGATVVILSDGWDRGDAW